MRVRVLIGAAVVAVMAVVRAEAASPGDRCEAGKLKAAGKYSACRLHAQAQGVLRNLPPDFSRCARKLADKWQLLEGQAGGACPSSGDEVGVQEVIGGYADGVAAALGGGALFDCPADLASCESVRDACLVVPVGQRLQTGQVACFDSAGATTPCAGTGQDGESQHGLPASFVDNGDDTITDARTGLTWERLSSDGAIHDQRRGYTWADAFATKIALLNAANFAGYDDWRLPNVNELQSLANYGAANPAVVDAFDTNCIAGCVEANCSCTASSGYWTSTSSTSLPASALTVEFGAGLIGIADKEESRAVRAVRGGS